MWINGIRLVEAAQHFVEVLMCHSSCFGKVMQGVGLRAKRAGVMAIGLSGSLGRDATKLFDYGIESLATTVDAPMTLETALSRAEELYYLGAIRMFRLVRVGMKIAQS